MGKSMLKREIPVYSEEFDIHGVIKDYGVVTKLFFTYENREIVMGIDRNPLEEEKFEDMGRNLIESYVRNLLSQDRKLQLHYWYIAEHEIHGEICRIGHGIVTGHSRISDAVDMHTSTVQAVGLDEDSGELILTTRNRMNIRRSFLIMKASRRNMRELLSIHQLSRVKFFWFWPTSVITIIIHCIMSQKIRRMENLWSFPDGLM